MLNIATGKDDAFIEVRMVTTGRVADIRWRDISVMEQAENYSVIHMVSGERLVIGAPVAEVIRAIKEVVNG